MKKIRILSDLFPKESKRYQFIKKCASSHDLHLHELHDGSMTLQCFVCGYKFLLEDEEEQFFKRQINAE